MKPHIRLFLYAADKPSRINTVTGGTLTAYGVIVALLPPELSIRGFLVGPALLLGGAQLLLGAFSVRIVDSLCRRLLDSISKDEDRLVTAQRLATARSTDEFLDWLRREYPGYASRALAQRLRDMLLSQQKGD